MAPQLKSAIDNLIQSNKVVVFMKVGCANTPPPQKRVHSMGFVLWQQQQFLLQTLAAWLHGACCNNATVGTAAGRR